MALPNATFADMFTVSRASAATARDSGGARIDIASGAARLDFTSGGSPRGLLIEGQDTNFFPNPRFVGAVPGTPPTGSPPTGGTTGTPPTGFVNYGPANGLSVQLVGVQTIAGDEFLVTRIYGTALAATSWNLTLAQSLPWTAAQQLDLSADFVLLGGSTAGFSLMRVAGNATGIASGNNVIGQLGSTPVTSTATKAAGVGGSDGTTTFFMNLTPTAGAQVDMTFGIGRVRMLRGGRTGQSFIRPAVGATGATTRAVEDVRWRRPDLWNPARVVGGSNVGTTMVLECELQSVAPAGADQGIWRYDDGTPSNRLEVYVPAGTSNVVVRRVIDNAASSVTLGSYTPGVPFRVVIAATSSQLIATVSGGDLVTMATGGTFTPARALAGQITTDGLTPMWGWLRGVLHYPLAKPNLVLLQLADTSISLAVLIAEGNA